LSPCLPRAYAWRYRTRTLMPNEGVPLFGRILDWIGRKESLRAGHSVVRTRRDEPSQDLLRAFRILGVVAAVLFPVFGWVHLRIEPGSMEPMAERFAFGAACLVVVGMTFVRRLAGPTIVGINVILFIAGPWVISVAIRNGFEPMYTLTTLMTVAIASAGFSRKGVLAAFLALSFACTVWGLMMSALPGMDRFYVAVVMGCLCFFSYLFGYSRLRVQERVGELEDLRRVLIDQSSDALVIIDPISREAVEWNSRAQSVFNLTRDEAVTGLPAAVFGAAEWRAVDAVLILRDVAERGIHRRERLYLVEDARAFWGDLSVTALRLGRRGLLLARVADVTARRRMEGKLGLAEQEQRFFAEQSADVLLRMTPVGYCLEISAAVRSLLGVAPEEVAGRSLYEFVHPDDTDALRRWAETPAGGRTFRQRCRMRRGDGTNVWADFLARKVMEPGTEELREVVAVLRDASESKSVEEGLDQGA